jgi:hypothetical protein
MANFLDIALHHAALGLYVFPVARDKSTVTSHGFKDASLDPETIRAWWTQHPSANPGFSPGASDVAVLDVDHGLTDMASFIAWRDRNGLPATYTVRSGSRPEFKVHMYYRGAMRDVGAWELDGCSGQVKSLGGYVLAAGSEALHGAKHDKPGAPYEAIDGALGVFAPTPDVVRQLKKPATISSNNSKVPKTAWSLPVHAGENRTGFLLEQTGAMRNLGCGKDAILARMIELNEDPEIIAEPVDYDRLESTAANCAKFPVPEVAPIVELGGKPEEKKITDWRERYLTFERVRDAKPVEFLIEGFLALDSITALAAPVGQRKSLIALNVAHALCTGAPLFNYFKVAKMPARVVYLCPEMGLSSFSTRLKQIGLDSHIGQSLFCQTMDDESIKLAELDKELPGAVVIIDTLTRFVEGDQNSSEDMSRFAKVVFGLKRRGATIVLLHHSIKGTANAPLTLDSAMRGSTELAAFVTCCWATRLQNPDEPYNSPSLLVNVKQRDFESKPFEASCDKTCRMQIIGEPGQLVELKSKADADAHATLTAILKQDPKMGIKKLMAALKDAGHGKGQKWVSRARMAILGTGVTLTTS